MLIADRKFCTSVKGQGFQSVMLVYQSGTSVQLFDRVLDQVNLKAGLIFWIFNKIVLIIQKTEIFPIQNLLLFC